MDDLWENGVSKSWILATKNAGLARVLTTQYLGGDYYRSFHELVMDSNKLSFQIYKRILKVDSSSGFYSHNYNPFLSSNASVLTCSLSLGLAHPTATSINQLAPMSRNMVHWLVVWNIFYFPIYWE